MNKEEFDTYTMVNQHPQQKRPVMRLNGLLCKIARGRAEDMARRNYFSHVNPEGVGPNQNLVNQGYSLPGYSLGQANSVESIFKGSGTYGTPSFVVQTWVDSPLHRPDVFGQTSFTVSKTEIGVGKASGGEYSYYVFISAPANANPAPPDVTVGLPNQLSNATIFPEAARADGWKRSSWFGWLNDSAYPLVQHQFHGRITVKATSASSVYYYDAKLGWVMTSAAKYPVIYVVAKKANYRYVSGKLPKRTFINLKTKKKVKG